MKLVQTTYSTVTHKSPMKAVKRTRGGARVPEGVTALARIGEDIEQRWAACDHRRKYFHDIAAECPHELQTIDNDGSFEMDGYVVVRQVFDQQSVDIYRSYALMLGDKCFSRPEHKHGFRDRYADTLMESILVHLRPAMEQITGLNLLPTYSFLRIYETGAVLVRHTDRRACEISASVTLGYDAPEPWALWLEAHQQPRSITLHPGDMLVYKGRELPHWRERFDGNYWIQAFFHYVDANGPLASYKYDGRRGLGLAPD